jgi:hypothetical protein
MAGKITAFLKRKRDEGAAESPQDAAAPAAPAPEPALEPSAAAARERSGVGWRRVVHVCADAA